MINKVVFGLLYQNRDFYIKLHGGINMLWRKKNSYAELVEIVKMMHFNSEMQTRNYNGNVFTNKKYPVYRQTLESKLLEIENTLEQNGWDEEYADQMATHYLSQFVYSNISYNNSLGSWKVQFEMFRDAYYYFKRMDKAGVSE